jgi:hypothetical protein
MPKPRLIAQNFKGMPQYARAMGKLHAVEHLYQATTYFVEN